jgi:hypothetical protein
MDSNPNTLMEESAVGDSRLVPNAGETRLDTRYYWLMFAEGHLTRTRFAAMLRNIPLLPLPAN